MCRIACGGRSNGGQELQLLSERPSCHPCHPFVTLVTPEPLKCATRVTHDTPDRCRSQGGAKRLAGQQGPRGVAEAAVRRVRPPRPFLRGLPPLPAHPGRLEPVTQSGPLFPSGTNIFSGLPRLDRHLGPHQSRWKGSGPAGPAPTVRPAPPRRQGNRRALPSGCRIKRCLTPTLLSCHPCHVWCWQACAYMEVNTHTHLRTGRCQAACLCAICTSTSCDVESCMQWDTDCLSLQSPAAPCPDAGAALVLGVGLPPAPLGP